MRVSFVIPAFNAESTIRTAVESALSQTVAPAEVIVVDDASTDQTLPVLQEIRDPRLRILQLETNSGSGAARYSAMEAATGELVACLDADDTAEAGRLALQVPVFEQNPGVVLVCGSTTSASAGGAESLYRGPSNPGSFVWAVLFRNPIATSTATFRRTDALAARRHSLMRLSEDHALWLALSVRGEIRSVPEVVARRSLHPHSLTATRCKDLEAMSFAVAIEAIGELTGSTPSEASYGVLRCGAPSGAISDEVLEEAIQTWSRVFDAVQRRLQSGSDRRAAGRESLNELRRLLRARPERRYDTWRRTVVPRRSVFAGTLASVESLKVVRTMVEGR